MFHIINRKDYQTHVIDYTDKTVLLNFWTGWSDACGTMANTFHLLQNSLGEQHYIGFADWDQQRWLADLLYVYGVPTLLVFDQGLVKATILGVISPEELLALLNNVKIQHLFDEEYAQFSRSRSN